MFTTTTTATKADGYLVKLYCENGASVCTQSEPVSWSELLFILWRTRRTLSVVHIERCGRR